MKNVRGDIRATAYLLDRHLEAALVDQFECRELDRPTGRQPLPLAQTRFLGSNSHAPILASTANLHSIRGSCKLPTASGPQQSGSTAGTTPSMKKSSTASFTHELDLL